jgi:hypothetical protein
VDPNHFDKLPLILNCKQRRGIQQNRNLLHLTPLFEIGTAFANP